MDLLHKYAYWGVGHMSYPDDPTGCCGRPEGHALHLCHEAYKVGREWRYCTLPFDHDTNQAHSDGAR